jgi:pimeloyl-ACP methyl ester carboxylesterase
MRVQAVARLNRWDRNVGTGAGNGFSQVAVVDRGEVPLAIDQRVAEQVFEETRWSKLVSVRSRLLSDFHNRDVLLRACITLPASYYEKPQQRYPVILDIPGFGGTHAHGRRSQPVAEQNQSGVEFLRVTLDPSCPLGHHAFADSANNGPVGQALIAEFLPELDRSYRTIADSRARFLTGHSSGGWSSLWLQVTYPESFGGVWSTAPDPVDFRDFQRINLYQPGVNMYVDERGNRRPLAVVDGTVAVWYDDFAWMEYVLGQGGQLHSFEAVFSPRSKAGHPELLWNRETGAVNNEVARSWESYDTRLVLERNWDRLEPHLAGKLHVFMGSADTFLLEGATRLLQQSLERLGSDAVVEIHEGKDHRTLLSGQLRSRIRREMTARFLTAFPDWSESPSPAP